VSVVVSDGLVSTNATTLVTVACQLTISKMQATLNFAKSNADNVRLSALLDLADFNPAGKVVALDIGGVQVSFTLDAKGRAANSLGSCKLVYNKKTSLWTLTVNLAKGSWRTRWAAHGLENKTVLKPGEWITMPVGVLIGDEAFADEHPMVYTATFNKSGSAK
jgi:hypothetical protein